MNQAVRLPNGSFRPPGAFLNWSYPRTRGTPTADFRTATALSLLRRTAPFVVFRLVVYTGIALAYVLATGAGAGVGYGIGAFWGPEGRLTGSGYGALGGFALTAAALYLMREYLLYIVKAGQRPDPSWTARLDSASDTFGALGQRAVAWTRPQPTTGVPA